jgi:ribosomal protein S18 acetylase RimI-like enzyme
MTDRRGLLRTSARTIAIVDVGAYERRDLDGVIALCEAEDWPSFPTDPERAHRALTAAGVTAVVARERDRVIGFAQFLGDGEITVYLASIAVAADQRRRGVARELVTYGFRRTGGERVDLLTDTAPAFYESFPHRRFEGFRIYPEAAESGTDTP